jgi:hypothetical protein
VNYQQTGICTLENVVELTDDHSGYQDETFLQKCVEVCLKSRDLSKIDRFLFGICRRHKWSLVDKLLAKGLEYVRIPALIFAPSLRIARKYTRKGGLAPSPKIYCNRNSQIFLYYLKTLPAPPEDILHIVIQYNPEMLTLFLQKIPLDSYLERVTFPKIDNFDSVIIHCGKACSKKSLLYEKIWNTFREKTSPLRITNSCLLEHVISKLSEDEKKLLLQSAPPGLTTEPVLRRLAVSLGFGGSLPFEVITISEGEICPITLDEFVEGDLCLICNNTQSHPFKLPDALRLEGKKCPMCRKHLVSGSLYKISFA